MSTSTFAAWTATSLQLSNGVVERTLRLPTADKPYLTTTAYHPTGGVSKYFTGNDGKFASESSEFSFLLNDVAYDQRSGWNVLNITPASDALQGAGVDMVLRSADGAVEVTVTYLLYPGLPVVRKRLAIRNLSAVEVALESVLVECFQFEAYWAGTFSWLYSDYGRRKSLIPFTGTMQDSLVALHNPDWGQGIVLGNEASGVNKYTAAFVEGANFKSGLAPKDADLPFRRWLAAGESFSTPQVFSIVYDQTPRFEDILNTVVPDFVRKHMGIRLSRFAQKPTFVYNTWEPFQFDIHEKMIIELANAAAAAGMKEFVIDDGWQDVYGDWGVDKTKFPNGLKPVFDHIKSLGMKPGLWVSIGTADPKSEVYQAHPDWFVCNQAGKPYSMILEDDKDNKYTACFSTGWRQHIQDVLLRLTAEHGLEYLKLDFAIVTTPYRHHRADTGCYATHHTSHKDHAESLSVNYDAMWEVFDAFHDVNPHVFIDCTFETMGGLQLIDYAMLQHAEGNWLSNYNEPNEVNDLRVRNMAWWRSPAMPATALVIGNSKLADAGYELHLQSLAGALPILLGDPRTMDAVALQRCRVYADWFEAMQTRHDAFSFRQDLPGFGEPQLGFWDGFQRINTDTRSGGMVGIFRHGALDTTRTVRVAYLDPQALYSVQTLDGVDVTQMTGHALATTGFPCTLDAEFSGCLWEVVRAEG